VESFYYSRNLSSYPHCKNKHRTIKHSETSEEKHVHRLKSEELLECMRGGWPVYYNNCASKSNEAMKNGNGKSASTVAGAGAGAEGGAAGGDGAPDITKSFLLFCPYAMSWAITVLANFNDPSIPVMDPTIPSITSTTTAPATTTTATATSTATTTAAINSNDNKSKKNTDTDDKTQKAKSVSPDILSLKTHKF
jgi:hypothetical protein